MMVQSHKCQKNRRGSVLAIVMIYFVVFSLTGLAALAVASYYKMEVVQAKQNESNYLAVESVLNEALWRINVGADSLADFSRNGITSTYSSITRLVTISSEKRTISVALEDMHPFSQGVAFRDAIDTSSYSITLLPGHGIRQFPTLPTIDTTYYLSHAVAVYNGGNINIEGVMASGIHYVKKGTVFLKNGTYLDGTLVIMGKLKVVGTDVILNAIPDSNGTYLPALIVADSTSDISTTPGIIIRGPIFSAGPFSMKGGTLTGPLVGTEIELSSKLDINDLSNEKYYDYPPGFGDVHAYDWPKRISAQSWKVVL